MESMIRINYDDVNESLTNQRIVDMTFKKLGVQGAELKDVNSVYEKICALPYRKVEDSEEVVYDFEEATKFWRENTFAKTFRERRSYLQIFRTFWRLFALHFLLFHELLIIVSTHYNFCISGVCFFFKLAG